MFVLAGLLSALTARLILGLVGKARNVLIIVMMAPAVEESAKSGLALLLDTNVFLAHAVFGGVELVADSLGGRGIWPGLAALVLHSLLGFATVWLLTYVGVAMAVVLAALLHGLWNYTAVRLL
ncbi:hypothetical protein [Desulfoscipio sp. XC116]|uniref:hypothetical protein n=1 Tax=Desulfoscipio sp. XC116 TaxID=3144975 RepID=UPI00325A90E2